MSNYIIKICLILFIFTCVIINLVDASMEISQTAGSVSAWFGQSEGYVNVGQGQSFYVNQEGWISEIQIYLEPSTGMPDPGDQIICDLRSLSDGNVLQSSSIKGFTEGGWKSFGFDKKVALGNYIFTCYFSRSYTLRDENFVIYGNSNDNSYLQGTRYDSIGGHPEDWSTWKKSVWDLKFKVIILTESERNSPETPGKPSGPSSGSMGTSYTYSTSSTDPNNDRIKYTFDWGDRTQSATSFANSGSSESASHNWTNPGTYNVKVMATDIGGLSSGWSSTFTVNIESAPQLSVSPDSLSFNLGLMNAGKSSSQILSISNAGGGTLTWSVSDDQTWITMNPTSGSNSGTVNLNIDTVGMRPGTYIGTIAVNSNGGTRQGKVFFNIESGWNWEYIIIIFLIIAIPVGIFLLKRKTGKSKEEQKMEEWEKEGYDVSGLKKAFEKKK